MDFDRLREVWNSQEGPPPLRINPDQLLAQTERDQRRFAAMILWRDIREVGVCVLVGLGFAWWGAKTCVWPWGVLSASCFLVAGFMLVDRVVQRRRRPAYSESLRQCAEGFLMQVDHQIWLLRNVFWWYLLPFAAGIAVLIAYSAWTTHDPWWLSVIGAIVVLGLTAALYYGVYWLNQLAVQKALEPRAAELRALLETLHADRDQA